MSLWLIIKCVTLQRGCNIVRGPLNIFRKGFGEAKRENRRIRCYWRIDI